MSKMIKINRFKKLIVRYAWAGSLIGFAVGFVFGPGIVWQIFDFRLKTRASVLEQVKIEKDLYERRQSIQSEISSSISQYIPIRDSYFLNKSDYQPTYIDQEKHYQIQNEFNITKSKLVNLIEEYNEIEINLSLIEGRQPHFFVLRLPPIAPHLTKDGKKKVFSIEPLPQDPLVIDAEKDLNALFHQHGYKYPSDNNWIDANAANFDPSNIGYKIYYQNLTDDHSTLISNIPPSNKN